MRKIFSILLLLFSVAATGQSRLTDSLKQQLTKAKDDTSKVWLFIELSKTYYFSNHDSVYYYAQKGLQLARQLRFKKGEAECYLALSFQPSMIGNYAKTSEYQFQALHIYEELQEPVEAGFMHIQLASTYREQGDLKRALEHALLAKKAAEQYNVKGEKLRITYGTLGSIYEETNQLDSALKYTQRAYKMDATVNNGKWPWLLYVLGNIYGKQGQYVQALQYYHKAIPLLAEENNIKDMIDTYTAIANIHLTAGNGDSAIFYAKKALEKDRSTHYAKGIQEAASLLAKAYKREGNSDSSLKYFEFSSLLKDSINNIVKEREVQNLAFNDQLRRQELQQEKAQYRRRVLTVAFACGLVVLSIVTLLLWRNNRHKQKANVLLQQQKEKTEQALQELKSTQAQLIQSEKMASLGELTAGIAHEIQNPLNFVNNFSEVNNELVEEIKNENNIDEIKAIADDIKQNSEKILFHGKRADAIVKGMLQHSRTNTGKKELTDINALADEYLRLSYHGLRAKDKSFDADFKTDFNESTGKINVVPQDMGRVLLNLFNNAFYAVNEKKQLSEISYKPSVSVQTKRLNDKVEIIVSDNGNGIPQNIVDKIFQPFFTTKPTGQGTGLGLSLSYDIIKVHGGELRVETKEGEGAEFIIVLPLK